MRSGVAQALQQAGQQLQGTLEDKAVLVASISLTVLEVLETLVLYLELEWVDEQRRIVQYIHGCNVDGRHAVLSGPGSLNTSDGPLPSVPNAEPAAKRLALVPSFVPSLLS